ncbi:hypothetical protein BDR04DRAFT_1097979 [Suillus decipiens]|nr:hypothetical protein BDR04DRAFT_1097979 [Suillus decipiens]
MDRQLSPNSFINSLPVEVLSYIFTLVTHETWRKHMHSVLKGSDDPWKMGIWLS